MMQNYIDILRQLNYELVKELGLFKHRAGLSFSQPSSWRSSSHTPPALQG